MKGEKEISLLIYSTMYRDVNNLINPLTAVHGNSKKMANKTYTVSKRGYG